MIYADSSFFVSAYTSDTNSPEVRRRLAASPHLTFTPFHRAEFLHAIARMVFEGRISQREANAVIRDLNQDCAAGLWHQLEFPVAAFVTCAELARRFVPALGTRTLDSLHVACALELKTERFWTFDERQKKLARAAGLKTN